MQECARDKTSKNQGLDPPKLPLDASKSDPERPKTQKKTTNMSKKRRTNAQEAAKSEKKAPKTEKCANIAPILGFGAGSVASGAPP